MTYTQECSSIIMMQRMKEKLSLENIIVTTLFILSTIPKDIFVMQSEAMHLL